MYHKDIVEKVKRLRLEGKTYPEIRAIFNIPKATLSDWFCKMELSSQARATLAEKAQINLARAREQAFATRSTKRQAYLRTFFDKNLYLLSLLGNKDVAKIALAMLYLGEGAKNMKQRAFMFGNSDPEVIKLFLALMRQCYPIKQSKFRCTIQCRADQNTGQLEQFWYNVTGIPREQFYKTRIDPRTIGKVSNKLGYKGVCRINYFSAEIFIDIMQTIKVLTLGR